MHRSEIISDGAPTGIYHTVTLGAGNYGNRLVVGPGTAILPRYDSGYASNGVAAVANLAGVSLQNYGTIDGADGSRVLFGGNLGHAPYGTPGGYGVYLGNVSSAKIVNHGVIAGGAGTDCDQTTDRGGYGGVGVLLGISGSITNGGTISGGAGGYSYLAASGQGGIGVELSTAAALQNSGVIEGGGASMSANATAPVRAGTGVFVGNDGRVTNTGLIAGGQGGTSGARIGVTGGDGVAAAQKSTVTNGGAIEGGAGGDSVYLGGTGGVGVYLQDFVVLTNTKLIAGGAGGDGTTGPGGNGGKGIYLQPGGTATNAGTIAGGAGGGGMFSGGQGGAGAYLVSQAVLTNTHVITGGAGGLGIDFGGDGGVGIDLGQGGRAANTGTISGGGGGGGYHYEGGSGGDGAVIEKGATLTNRGLIVGGYGADQRNYNSGAGGAGVILIGAGTLSNSGTIEGGAAGNYYNALYDLGGIGVRLATGASVTNSGLIEGGAGGRNDYQGAIGGAGVYIYNATLTNTGTIAGGAGGAVGNFVSYGGAGGAGVYIDGGTLIDAGLIEGGGGGSGATGNGANGAAVQFGDSNAATLVLEKGARLSGQVVASTKVADTLELGATTAGTLSGIGTAFSNFAAVTELAHAHLILTGNNSTNGAMVLAGALNIAGSLTVQSVTIDVGGSLAGTGLVAAPVTDLGSLSAAGGTLLVSGALAGQGALSASSSSVLDILGGGTIGGSISGAGTVRIDSPVGLAAGAHLGVANLIETANVTLAAGESLANAAAHNFTLTQAAGNTVQIFGAAGDKLTNAGTLTGNGAGLKTISLGLINQGLVSTTAGTMKFLGAVTNTGTMTGASGLLSLAQSVSGTGVLNIGATGTLALQAGAAAGEHVDFLGGAGLLDLTHPLDFAGSISGFSGHDTIDLTASTATTFTYAAGTLTIDDGATKIAALHFSGTYTQASFAVTNSAGDVLIKFL